MNQDLAIHTICDHVKKRTPKIRLEPLPPRRPNFGVSGYFTLSLETQLMRSGRRLAIVTEQEVLEIVESLLAVIGKN